MLIVYKILYTQLQYFPKSFNNMVMPHLCVFGSDRMPTFHTPWQSTEASALSGEKQNF